VRRLVVLIALVLFALALPAVGGDKNDINTHQPMDVARGPAPGKALIYFARTQSLGMAVKVKLYADGKFAGLIMSNTYIALEVDPGKHEFIVTSENAGFLEAEVAPDKIYVVQVAIHMGALKARTHFETARTGSEAMEEFLKDQKDLHSVTTTEEGLEWVQEEDPKIQEVIKKFRDKGEEFEQLKPEDGFASPPWLK